MGDSFGLVQDNQVVSKETRLISTRSMPSADRLPF